MKKTTVQKLPTTLETSAEDARLLAQVIDYYHETLKQSKETAVTLDDEETQAALYLLKSPDLLSRIQNDFTRCGVVGEATNKLVGYLAVVSRKLDSPLTITIQSTSAAGKSSLMDAVLAFMPDEERIKYSAMTGQSLFYMGETDLQHKVLAIVEEEGASNAAYALTLLQSEGELTIASTGKDPITGHAIQRNKRTLAGLMVKADRESILSLHQNAQRLLQPLAVMNPYAKHLTFVDDRTQTRRDHEKYLTLIDTLALLHQHQRPIKAFFKWLTKENHILYNPASEMELPKVHRRLPKHILSDEEVGRIINQTMLHGEIGIRDRAIIETLYSSGIRRLELINLKLYDVDTRNGTLMVRQGKGKKDRMVPLGQRACIWIDKYTDEVRPGLVVEPDDGWLFLHEYGEPFHNNRLTDLVKKYIEAAGIDKPGACHLFRHTMATLMLDNGADIRHIQAMLGHSQLSTTEIYTQVSIKKLKEIHTLTHPADRSKASDTSQ